MCTTLHTYILKCPQSVFWCSEGKDQRTVDFSSLATRCYLVPTMVAPAVASLKWKLPYSFKNVSPHVKLSFERADKKPHNVLKTEPFTSGISRYIDETKTYAVYHQPQSS